MKAPTTETALTEGLSEELWDAWDRLKAFAMSLGEQRVYASHKSIMFSHKNCHFFVRPKTRFLEVCFFLPHRVNDERIHRAVPSSRTKVAHLVRVAHRDEVEAPLTEWLAEAFRHSLAQGTGSPAPTKRRSPPKKPRAAPKKRRR